MRPPPGWHRVTCSRSMTSAGGSSAPSVWARRASSACSAAANSRYPWTARTAGSVPARGPSGDHPLEHRCAAGDLVHEVEGEPLGDGPTRLHPPDAVAALVEPRAVETDAELRRAHRHDPTGHPRLGRQPDPEEPLAGEVVHPARGHDGEYLLGRPTGPVPVSPVLRVHPAVGQRGRHRRQIDGGHQHGALSEVGVDRVLHVGGRATRRDASGRRGRGSGHRCRARTGNTARPRSDPVPAHGDSTSRMRSNRSAGPVAVDQ